MLRCHFVPRLHEVFHFFVHSSLPTIEVGGLGVCPPTPCSHTRALECALVDDDASTWHWWIHLEPLHPRSLISLPLHLHVHLNIFDFIFIFSLGHILFIISFYRLCTHLSVVHVRQREQESPRQFNSFCFETFPPVSFLRRIEAFPPLSILRLTRDTTRRYLRPRLCLVLSSHVNCHS